jgi:hypothetical protein
MKIDAVRACAMSLADTTEEPHHHFGSFRVRGKIFLTVPPDQEHLHVFVSDEVREAALAMDPAFLEKLLWGGKVVGLRVSLPQAKAAVVKSLVLQAHAHNMAKARGARKKRMPGHTASTPQP